MTPSTAMKPNSAGTSNVSMKPNAAAAQNAIMKPNAAAAHNAIMKPTAAAAQNASGHESEIRPEPGAAALERQGLLFREIQMRKERNKVRRRYVLMIIVAFLFSVALIFRYSFVIEINEQILRDKSTLTKLENENSLAQKQIAGETDLEKVRLIAESKLDMQKPDRDQIVYIRVPKKDHALVASAKRQDPDAMNPIEYLLEQIRLIHKRLISD